jgi:hypothetical protein
MVIGLIGAVYVAMAGVSANAAVATTNCNPKVAVKRYFIASSCALGALNNTAKVDDFSPSEHNSYGWRGVVRMMPGQCRRIIIMRIIMRCAYVD